MMRDQPHCACTGPTCGEPGLNRHLLSASRGLLKPSYVAPRTLANAFTATGRGSELCRRRDQNDRADRPSACSYQPWKKTGLQRQNWENSLSLT